MNDHPNSVKAASFYSEHLPTQVVERGDGWIVMETEFEAQHLNAANVVHGGVIAALLDIASAGGASTSAGELGRAYGITLSFTVNFLTGAKIGKARIEGRVTGGGRKTKFVDGKLTDAAGNLCATSTATVKVIDLAAG